MSANGKIFAEEFSPIGSIKPSDKVLVEDAIDKVVKYGLFGQLTAINGYAYRNSIAELPLPPAQPNIAYVVGREFYVYVGEGGDTAGGAYQSIEFGVGGLSIEELQTYLDTNGYVTEEDLPEGGGASQEWVTQQIQAAIDALVGDAPETLDTLKEIADMLGDNTDDITGLISAMENKADKATTLAGYGITDAYTKSQVDTFLASKSGIYNNLAGYGITDAYTITQIDNIVSELNTEIGKKWTQNNDDIAKWNAAYSWGNHASAGYVTETELLEKEYASVAYVVAGYARNTIKISAGTGLTGGGNLEADRTLSLASVGTAGTYTKVTTDAYGRVTSGATLSASDIPNLDWGKITSGKPTTISGYGITDAYTKTQIDTELAKYVKLATAQDITARHNFTDGLQIGGLPITKSADGIIYLDANLVVSGAITMFGSGSTTFPTIWANIPFDLDTMEWTGSVWRVIGGGSGSVDEATVNTLIREYLYENSYAQISDISSALASYQPLLSAANKLPYSYISGTPTIPSDTNQLTNSAGYITSSALAGYATESWVGNNYLSLSGGTINGSITATSFVGNLTGNADSATELQTRRTIWGQSFDGTGNVDGALLVNAGSYIPNRATVILNSSDAPADLIFKNNSTTVGNYGCWAISSRSGEDNRFTIWRGGENPLGSEEEVFSILASGVFSMQGNVAIGGTEAGSCRLRITTSHQRNFSWETGLLANNSDFGIDLNGQYGIYTSIGYASGDVAMQVGRSDGIIQSYHLLLQPLGGNVAIGGTTASEKLHVHGNILATGAITMFSQKSMKNVIDYDGLSLAQLEQIKPARFTWKDGRDSLVHAGGIADDVMQVLPEVVHRTTDGKLTMDYGSAGFFIASSLIKPVIDHEQRIAELERENKALKQQLEQLKLS